jgi:hypothetical protein
MMTTRIFITLTALFIGFTVQAQNSGPAKSKFVEAVQSGEIKNGCIIVVSVNDADANSSCNVPDASISKVAHAAASAMNTSTKSELVENMPNTISSGGNTICTLSYKKTGSGITYTFDFAEGQGQEIKWTSNWLNSLDGFVEITDYSSR